jgi:hypothetical protein
MTAVCMMIKPDVALLATDSLLGWSTSHGGILRDWRGLPMHDSKLVILSAAGCAFATIGTRQFRSNVLERSAVIDSFDTAFAVLPAVLRGAMVGLEGQQRLFLAGWSDAHQGMAGAVFESAYDFVTSVSAPKLGGTNFWVHPPAAADMQWPRAAEPEQMHALLQFQIDHYRRELGPDIPTGGRCCVATVTRDSITTRMVGELGTPRAKEAA